MDSIISDSQKCLCIHNLLDCFETFVIDENTIGIRPIWFDAFANPSPPLETVHLLVDGKVIIGWNESAQPEEDPVYCSWELWPECHIKGEGVTHWAPLLKAPEIK